MRLLLAPFRGLAGLARRLGAWALVSIGRWRLLRGDAEGAAEAFEAAAARVPGWFAPYLHLARARLRCREAFHARRALAQAREASPRRFEREARDRIAREGFDLDALTGAPALPEPPARETAVLRSGSRSAGALPFGDCRDLDEYSRFQAMPPISPSELDDVDWDDVADDLQDG